MKFFMSALCALAAIVAFGSVASAGGGKWEKVGKKNGVMVHKKEVPGSDLLAFRGVITADIHIGKIMTTFIDEEQRGKWVDRYAGHRTLAKSDRSQTYWIHFGLPFPISDRDYVLKSDGFPDAEKKVVVTKIKSVTHPKAPENDCCVRAEAYGTYYKFEALPDGKTKLTVEVHTNPKGLLPGWLINSIQEDWPSKTLKALIKQAKGQKIHAEYTDWH